MARVVVNLIDDIKGSVGGVTVRRGVSSYGSCSTSFIASSKRGKSKKKIPLSSQPRNWDELNKCLFGVTQKVYSSLCPLLKLTTNTRPYNFDLRDRFRSYFRCYLLDLLKQVDGDFQEMLRRLWFNNYLLGALWDNSNLDYKKKDPYYSVLLPEVPLKRAKKRQLGYDLIPAFSFSFVRPSSENNSRIGFSISFASPFSDNIVLQYGSTVLFGNIKIKGCISDDIVGLSGNKINKTPLFSSFEFPKNDYKKSLSDLWVCEPREIENYKVYKGVSLRFERRLSLSLACGLYVCYFRVKIRGFYFIGGCVFGVSPLSSPSPSSSPLFITNIFGWYPGFSPFDTSLQPDGYSLLSVPAFNPSLSSCDAAPFQHPRYTIECASYNDSQIKKFSTINKFRGGYI